MCIRILLVNPNSSQSMTENMKINVESIFSRTSMADEVNVSYFTAPPEAPRQIENNETSIKSTKVCFPILNDSTSEFYYQRYDGILVGCFSDHPLVTALSNQNKIDNHQTIICGLLDTSINYCNMLNKKPFSIITSNEEWVSILNKSVEDKLLNINRVENNLWRGTVSTNLQVLDLDNPENLEQIISRIKNENVEKLGSDIVILGCAGFSCLKNPLTAAFNHEVTFIEPIYVGLNLLLQMIQPGASF